MHEKDHLRISRSAPLALVSVPRNCSCNKYLSVTIIVCFLFVTSDSYFDNNEGNPTLYSLVAELIIMRSEIGKQNCLSDLNTVLILRENMQAPLKSFRLWLFYFVGDWRISENST